MQKQASNPETMTDSGTEMNETQQSNSTAQPEGVFSKVKKMFGK